MSTQALLRVSERTQCLEHENAIWLIRAHPRNNAVSPGYHLIVLSMKPSGFLFASVVLVARLLAGIAPSSRLEAGVCSQCICVSPTQQIGIQLLRCQLPFLLCARSSISCTAGEPTFSHKSDKCSGCQIAPSPPLSHLAKNTTQFCLSGAQCKNSRGVADHTEVR